MGKRSRQQAKRKREIVSVREIERRLRRDNVIAASPSSCKDSEEGRTIQPGDVFMIQDDEFKNKYKETVNSNVIHYNRPAVVISVNKRTVNILAMTTKDRDMYDLTYPIMIEEGVVSNVIISQPLTVDFDRLTDYRGSIQQDILNDIRRTLTDYITCGASYCKPKIPLFAINTFRAIAFRVYRETSTGDVFMLLKLKNREGYIKVNVVNTKQETNNPTINIFCGKLDFSSISTATKLVHADTELVCIGEECNKGIREKIYDKLNSMYGIMINKSVKADIRSTIVLSTIMFERLFDRNSYIQSFDTVQDILYTHQKKYLDAPEEYIKEVFGGIEDEIVLRQIQNNIDKYLVMTCDIFQCDTRILDMGIRSFTDTMASRLENHKKGYIFNDKGIVTEYTNANQKYYLKNIRWIYKYHFPKQKKIGSKG